MEQEEAKANRMAQQFTWQQFLIAALVFSFIWYTGVILIFYRKELKAFLGRKEKNETGRKPLPHRWEKGVDKLENKEDEPLLGKTKMPEGISIVSTADFSFVSEASKGVPGDKNEQIGLVPDVLEDIKKVFLLLVKEDGNKKDFFKLMAEINKSYPKIASNPNIGRINEFISEHAPFHLSKEELENIWY
jgi:hypothetical protein